MRHDLQPLPVRVMPQNGESGLAFLLRAAQRNGMTLQVLFAWLGIGQSQIVTPDAVARLAWVTEVPRSWLETCMVTRGDGSRHRCCAWADASWACALALRGSRPQFCPACLREGRACQAMWELSGAFACLQHGALLCDTCGHCGRPLSWQRPSIDVCCCGHYFSKGQSPIAEKQHLAWTEYLLFKVNGRPTSSMPTWSHPAWFNHLSVDGIITIVHAVGVREKPNMRVSGASARAVPTPLAMCGFVSRALDRLDVMGTLNRPCSGEMRCLIYEQGLERLAVHGVMQADRDAGRRLSAWLKAVPEARITGRRPRKQLELFP